jgi:hypothetical protein
MPWPAGGCRSEPPSGESPQRGRPAATRPGVGHRGPPGRALISRWPGASGTAPRHRVPSGLRRPARGRGRRAGCGAAVSAKVSKYTARLMNGAALTPACRPAGRLRPLPAARGSQRRRSARRR